MKIEEAKTVYKPWGKEVWLELNDRYCYKRIYINAGHRTSYQYHEHKIETNFLISGEAEVWLENDEGIVEKTIMKAGEFFNVTPPKKHRVIAITDIILQEVSTPEVDDVIRIQDDTNRQDGKLEHEHNNPAMCILAAGKGERLGKYAKNFHKGLLPLGNKAAISHIIDKTPKDYDIVVAVGHNGNLIKEYCSAAHSDRNIEYVEVDNVDGEGSGPGYSMLKCKEYLNRPFYLSTVDCVIKGNLPHLDGNWLGTFPTSIPELYSTADVDEDNIITSFKNKSINGYENAFIGLCSILDFETFWKNLESNDNKNELVSAFYNPKSYDSLRSITMEWFDIGTIDSYLNAKTHFEKDKVQYGIPKENKEVVYKVGDNFVKYIENEDKVSNLVLRNKGLKGSPRVTYNGKNFFSYKWVSGETLYDSNKFKNYSNFLEWCFDEFWEETDMKINHSCEIFYKEKTMKRLNMFLDNRPDKYKESFTVMGKKCLPINEIMKKIDWHYLTDGTCTYNFHGDLQFDNVIVNDKGEFKLIDWRSDFADQTEYGDIYYDLSKMYGGILMSYKDMKNDGNISLTINNKSVEYRYQIDNNLIKMKSHFEKFVSSKYYDMSKIKKITALIFLNMAPLHSEKFGDMLFFKSLKMLNEIYK